MSVYLGFTDQADMEAQFGAKVPDGAEVIVAVYGEEQAYQGAAFVLFRLDGELFEVNGSHCSCYGLEGCWEPERTTGEALRARPHLVSGDYDFSKEQAAAVQSALAGL